ncbi:MAG: hypothetical protein LUF35_09495 [Lachnospiraceae bacterium]|nr:hypothetical protein [Lachnospiraceae bacterium]
MTWYRNLYIGKTFQGKQKKIMRQIRAGRPVRDLYLIVLRPDPALNQLEIFSQSFFQNVLSDAEQALIVGIASGMPEALGLLVQMTDQVYHETGGALLRDYILLRQKAENAQAQT